MATGKEIETVWKEGKAREAEVAPLIGESIQKIIASRVRKEVKTVAQFVWAAIAYQIILYSFLAHTLVRNWGDGKIMFLCLAGVVLYIPLTIALIRKVRKSFVSLWERGSAVPDVSHKVTEQYARLADFFQFKKRLDWIGVPVSCAIMVLVTFTLFLGRDVEENPLTALVLFALWVGMSLVAIHAENRKRFISPLQHLQQVLDDLKNS
jgi:hypothetical protein